MFRVSNFFKNSWNYFQCIQEARKIVNDSIPKMPPQWEKVPNISDKHVDQLPAHDRTIGYHGTSLSRVNDQIQKGFIEDRKEQFFIARYPELGGLYARKNHPGDALVVLKVEGPATRVFVHTLFNTEYFAGFEKLKIHEVYRQSAAFIEADKPENFRTYYPKKVDKYCKIYRTALDLINKKAR